MTSPSWQARLLNPLLKYTVRPVLFPRVATPGRMRLTARAFAQVEKLRPYPASAQFEPVLDAGFEGEWVSTGKPASKVMLYFHGGGYMIMSPRGYRDFTATLARAFSVRVLAVDYRQGADHPWPAPLHDALASYDWLLDQGIEAHDIIIGGDSAGGHLALSTLLAIRDLGLPRPRGGVLLSPWTNMGCDFLSHDANRDSDVLLDLAAVRSNAVFQCQGSELRDPANSPAFADYHGLPPLHIVASLSEILLDDARAARDAALAAGVEVDYHEWADMPHVFPTFYPLLPEAKTALDDMTRFVAELFRRPATN